VHHQVARVSFSLSYGIFKVDAGVNSGLGSTILGNDNLGSRIYRYIAITNRW
jgi:hypothetical protein